MPTKNMASFIIFFGFSPPSKFCTLVAKKKNGSQTNFSAGSSAKTPQVKNVFAVENLERFIRIRLRERENS